MAAIPPFRRTVVFFVIVLVFSLYLSLYLFAGLITLTDEEERPIPVMETKKPVIPPMPRIPFVNRVIQTNLRFSSKSKVMRDDQSQYLRNLTTEGGPFYDDTCPMMETRYHCWPRPQDYGSKRFADWTLSLKRSVLSLSSDTHHPGIFDSNLYDKYFAKETGLIHTIGSLFQKPNTRVFIASSSQGRQILETIICMLYAVGQTSWTNSDPSAIVLSRVRDLTQIYDSSEIPIFSFASHLRVPCMSQTWRDLDDHLLDISQGKHSGLDWFLSNQEYGKDPSIIAELRKTWPELINMESSKNKMMMTLMNDLGTKTNLTMKEYDRRNVKNAVIEDLIRRECDSDRLMIHFESNRGSIEFMHAHSQKQKSILKYLKWYAYDSLQLDTEKHMFEEWFCRIKVLVFNKGELPEMSITGSGLIRTFESIDEKRKLYCDWEMGEDHRLKIILLGAFWLDDDILGHFMTEQSSKKNDFIFISNQRILNCLSQTRKNQMNGILSGKYGSNWFGHFCMPGAAEHLALNLLESINSFFV